MYIVYKADILRWWWRTLTGCHLGEGGGDAPSSHDLIFFTGELKKKDPNF